LVSDQEVVVVLEEEETWEMFASKTAIHLRSSFLSALRQKGDKASKNKKLLEFLDSLQTAHMGFVLSAKAQIPNTQKQRLMSSSLFTSFISQDVLGAEPAVLSSPIESTALALDLVANIHLKFTAADALRLFLSGLSYNLEERRGMQQQLVSAADTDTTKAAASTTLAAVEASSASSHLDLIGKQAVLAKEEQETMLAQSLKELLQLYESAHSCSSAPPTSVEDGGSGGDGKSEMETNAKKQVSGPLKNESNNVMTKVKLTTYAQQIFAHELGSLPPCHISDVHSDVQKYLFALCQHGHFGAGNNLFIHFEKYFDVAVVEEYLLILIRAKEWERLQTALVALKRRGLGNDLNEAHSHKVVGFAKQRDDIASASAATSIVVEQDEEKETEAVAEVLEEENEDGLGARGQDGRKREEGEESWKDEERKAWLFLFVKSTIEQILVHKSELLALNTGTHTNTLTRHIYTHIYAHNSQITHTHEQSNHHFTLL